MGVAMCVRAGVGSVDVLGNEVGRRDGVEDDKGAGREGGAILKTMMRPSALPVMTVFVREDSWSWQTRAEWPWRRARHAPVPALHIRTVVSNPPLAILSPSKATV